HPVGSLRPNDLGLFDMHGNAWEWSQDAYDKLQLPLDPSPRDDIDLDLSIDNKTARVLLGSGWGNRAMDTRAAFRIWNLPTYSSPAIGFRPVRTLPAE